MTDASDALVASTTSGLLRLRTVLEGLTEADLETRPAAGWGVAATLVHLAFYDDWVAERWRRWLAAGRFQDLPDDISELVNSSGERGWGAADPIRARDAALEAAHAVTRLIGDLPPTAREDAIRTGRERMLDRSVHWDAHLDEIEALLGR